MLSSIGLTQGVVIQGGALLIDIGLALVLSFLYQRALELSAPEISTARLYQMGQATKPSPQSRKSRARSKAWHD